MGVTGGVCPDLDDAQLFSKAFNATQTLIAKGKLLAGHDRSDGGLLVTILEMAFAGCCGLHVDISGIDMAEDSVATLFGEDLGLALEVAKADESEVLALYAASGVPCVKLGSTLAGDSVTLSMAQLFCSMPAALGFVMFGKPQVSSLKSDSVSQAVLLKNKLA